MLRRYNFRRYAYLGVPPSDEVLFYEYGRRPREEIVYFNPSGVPKEEVVVSGNRVPREVIVNNIYDYLPFLYAIQPEPNYSLDDQIINEITYRILTQITQYKPKRKVEIAPVTRMTIDLV